MGAGYVAALDQGTTSTRCIIFDANGAMVARHQLGHQQIYPVGTSGWVEHDPLEVLHRCKECIDGAVAEFRGVGHGDGHVIRALGVTNQRETLVVWDRETGQPLVNAIVWLDTRTRETTDRLRGSVDEALVRQRTGLPISTYFTGVKLRWLLDHNEDVRRALHQGSAICGTIDSWIVWNLTGGVHVTDVTNAGRTMLMNVKTCSWDEQMLEMLDIPRSCLPEIRSSSEVYGFVKGTELDGVPLAGILGDQQSALVGQSCFDIGDAKCTYGTGCFLIVNTGTQLVYSNHGLLTTPAYQLGKDQPVVYSLEGSIAVAGAAISWLKENLGLIQEPSDMESLASSVPDSGGVVFVPAFSGLFAPRWRQDARGTIVGMTLSTTKAHLCRSVLESIAFQVCDILQATELDISHPLHQLRADGGAAVNNLLMQLQSDLLGIPVHCPVVLETTALGVAFAAGLAVKLFQEVDQLRSHWKLDRGFIPSIPIQKREEMLRLWERAVTRSLGWVDDEPRNDQEDEQG